MRANFINSVGNGQKIPCPSCNTLNEADSSFCMVCGTKLVTDAEPIDDVAIPNRSDSTIQDGVPEPVNTVSDQKKSNESDKKPVFKFVESEIEDEDEPLSVFAQGLPSWDIVPPQIIVRRKNKR